MPVVFGANTGRVIAIQDKVAQGGISLGNITAQGQSISFTEFNTIITRIGVTASGNYQFLHTIGNDVYVYVFGDRMGEITLHGLSFASNCSGTQNVADATDETELEPGSHGFERLFKWYQKSRIAVNPEPVRVSIGKDTVFKGFLTGITGDVNDSSQRTIQFQLTVSLLPDPIP